MFYSRMESKHVLKNVKTFSVKNISVFETNSKNIQNHVNNTIIHRYTYKYTLLLKGVKHDKMLQQLLLVNKIPN